MLAKSSFSAEHQTRAEASWYFLYLHLF